MTVLVCGGRDYANEVELFTTLDMIRCEKEITLIIHGGARGADALAGMWARLHKIPEKVFLPDWKTFGKSAGQLRNSQMLMEGNPDLVTAFSGGKGTQNMVSLARAAGVKVKII